MSEPPVAPGTSTSGVRRPPAWGRLVAVMFGLSVLGQLVGVVIGAQILFAVDYAEMQDHPNLIQLVNATSGLLAGLLGGLLIRPVPRRLATQVGVWAGVALATFLVIGLIGRLVTGPQMELSAHLRAGLIIIGLQVLPAWALWVLRRR